MGIGLSPDTSAEFPSDYERRAVRIGEALLGDALVVLRSRELWELVRCTGPGEGHT